MEEIVSGETYSFSARQQFFFHGIWRFIIINREADQESLILYTFSYIISLKFILILFSRLRLDFPIGFHPSGFQTKPKCVFLTFGMRATYYVQFVLLVLITLIISGAGHGSRAV
jgi:hypothetical protein